MHRLSILLLASLGLISPFTHAIETGQLEQQHGAEHIPPQLKQNMFLDSNNITSPPNASPTVNVMDSHPTNFLTTSDKLIHMEASLSFHESLVNRGPWKAIPRGKLLRFGDEHAHIPLLREKLVILGDHPPLDCASISDPLFDIELHDALVRFQTRHGGKQDGILGPQTRKQLNINPSRRAEQLKVNIHRIKNFLPSTDRFIQVNIPEFRLRLFEQGQPILSMKTIVGKKKRKTPVFDSQIDRVVINPSWHVPKSIAYKDILPALKADPDHLDKVNIKLVTGWGNNKQFISPAELDESKLYSGKNYQRFWQAPSTKNTLGSVKFLTNGPYAVYLHDTSAKRLFNEPNRAFSSGCIRLEEPRKLADALMRMTHGWDSSKLDPLFSQEKTKEFRLEDPIPLHVTYWTAWIDNHGLTHFRNDLYRRDRYELSQLQ